MDYCCYLMFSRTSWLAGFRSFFGCRSPAHVKPTAVCFARFVGSAVKCSYGGVRIALKASIAVVHRPTSLLPLFILVNQTSQGLKCLTQPRDTAVRHWWVGGEVNEHRRLIELFHCTKCPHQATQETNKMHCSFSPLEFSNQTSERAHLVSVEF